MHEAVRPRTPVAVQSRSTIAVVVAIASLGACKRDGDAPALAPALAPARQADAAARPPSPSPTPATVRPGLPPVYARRRMRLRTVALLASLVSAALSSACTRAPSDATIQSSLPGAWTWNPREQLPADQLENDTGIYATPDQQILQFGALVATDADRGAFVEYRHVPTNKNMKEAWVVWRRGSWFAAHAEVQLQSKPDAKLQILRLDADELRVSGVGFACKEGCVLRRLKEIPAAAQSGRPFAE